MRVIGRLGFFPMKIPVKTMNYSFPESESLLQEIQISSNPTKNFSQKKEEGQHDFKLEVVSCEQEMFLLFLC